MDYYYMRKENNIIKELVKTTNEIDNPAYVSITEQQYLDIKAQRALDDIGGDVDIYGRDQKRGEFRMFRLAQFRAYDIYKTNVQYGTELESPELHQEIVAWYNTMLEFADLITVNNYKDVVFPVTPAKIARYL